MCSTAIPRLIHKILILKIGKGTKQFWKFWFLSSNQLTSTLRFLIAPTLRMRGEEKRGRTKHSRTQSPSVSFLRCRIKLCGIDGL